VQTEKYASNIEKVRP
jgi:hypothetical protein